MSAELGTIGRRGFLSSAAAIGSVAFLSTVITPERAVAATGSVSAATFNPRSLETTYGIKRYMKPAPAGPGIIKSYENAFTSASIANMDLFTGKDGRTKASISVIGMTNQFQIVDAATGKNEATISLNNGSAGGVTGSAINPVDSMIYALSVGRLYRYAQGSSVMQDLGRCGANATAAYGPAFDSQGRVWIGTFPDASVVCYDPATNKFTEYPNVDSGSEYVRSIQIMNDVVYVGTGAVAPRVISFPVNAPTQRKWIPGIPDISAKGFVFRLDAHAGRMFASYETEAQVSKTAMFDPATTTWTVLQYPLDGRLSVSDPSETLLYFVTRRSGVRSVLRYNILMNSFGVICDCPTSPIGLMLGGTPFTRTLSVFGQDSTGQKYVFKTLTLSSGASTPEVEAKINASAFKVQDFIASSDGKLYVGGYMGDGIGSIDPKTDARWRSPRGSGINQIEGMIEHDGQNIYVGSYGSADLIHYKKDLQTYTRIVRLRTDYLQSRPFGWAVAGGRVICGTVPDYGYRGGSLVVIDPATDALLRVYTGTVQSPVINIADQSIVGLVGSGDIVYGTTSIKGGYGIPDDTNPAQVFAYNVKTDKALWSTGIKLVSETEIYDPVVVDGRLFVAVPNGIIELDINTGDPINSFVLFTRANEAGYRNVRMSYVESSSSLIHCGGGTVSAVSLKGYSRTLLYQGSGGTMRVKGNQVFAVTDGSLNISEIDVAYSPSIASAGDLVSISPGGGINYKRTLTNGTFAAGVALISSGYSDALAVHVVDWNGDGVFDLLSRHSDGSLRIRYGLRQGGFDADFTVVAATGWSTRRFAAGMWDSSTPYTDVISIDTSGKLERWKATSTGALTLVGTIGSGWSKHEIAILDYKYDGVPGLVFRDGVKMFWLAQGISMTPTSASRVEIASGGWSNCAEFAVVTGHFRQYNGIVWKDTTGLLRYTSNLSSTSLGGNFSYDLSLADYRIAGTSK